MTTTTPFASLADIVVRQIASELDIATEMRKHHLDAMTAAAADGKLIAPTRIEDFNRSNTEYAEWRRATNVLTRLLVEDDMTPEQAVVGLHRVATTELTGQGITRHTSGVSTDADLYERSVWARIFHMTENN